MAKTNKQNRRRRTHHPVVTVIVILLLVGILIFVSKMLANRASDDISENEKESSSKTVEEKKSQEKPNEDTTSSKEGESKTPIQNDGDDPNTKEYLTGVLTMAEVSGGILHIRTNIDQYLTAGTCELNISSDSGASFVDTAYIIPTASTSTCEGFDISTSYFTPGHWYINIELKSGDKTGTITGEVDI